VRIQDVELVPEHGTYKVDGSGRIIIPAYMRNKFGINVGDYMDYYTSYVDGDWFLCAKKHIFTPEELAELENKNKK
jgi:AbrB family looped-hinge helix DNA binding protein